MEIVLSNAQVQVGSMPNGMRVIQFVDQKSGITITVPLTHQAARTIGTALTTSLLVADGPLPMAQ